MHRHLHPDRIDGRRIRLLQVAKRQLGLDEDSWREILQRFGYVDSSKDLDLSGFKAVMIWLEHLGFQSTTAKRNFGNRPGMATAAQIALIRRLWRKLTPDDEKEQRLNAWLDKFHHVSALRFVDAEKVKSVITALMAMSRRR